MFRSMSCFLLISLCGCAIAADHSAQRVTFENLKTNGLEYANANIILSGYLMRDAIGNVLLYKTEIDAKESNYANEIDVVQKSAPNFDTAPNKSGSCASVEGRFIPFNDQTVGMGYLRSHYGMIEATQISQHECSE